MAGSVPWASYSVNETRSYLDALGPFFAQVSSDMSTSESPISSAERPRPANTSEKSSRTVSPRKRNRQDEAQASAAAVGVKKRKYGEGGVDLLEHEDDRKEKHAVASPRKRKRTEEAEADQPPSLESVKKQKRIKEWFSGSKTDATEKDSSLEAGEKKSKIVVLKVGFKLESVALKDDTTTKANFSVDHPKRSKVVVLKVMFAQDASTPEENKQKEGGATTDHRNISSNTSLQTPNEQSFITPVAIQRKEVAAPRLQFAKGDTKSCEIATDAGTEKRRDIPTIVLWPPAEPPCAFQEYVKPSKGLLGYEEARRLSVRRRVFRRVVPSRKLRDR